MDGLPHPLSTNCAVPMQRPKVNEFSTFKIQGIPNPSRGKKLTVMLASQHNMCLERGQQVGRTSSYSEPGSVLTKQPAKVRWLSSHCTYLARRWISPWQRAISHLHLACLKSLIHQQIPATTAPLRNTPISRKKHLPYTRFISAPTTHPPVARIFGRVHLCLLD